LGSSDFRGIFEVINDGAQAFRGVIPKDRWKEPYMSAEELKGETEAEAQFYGWTEDHELLGVMGIQAFPNISLIRHSYVLSEHQRGGIGTKLLKYLIDLTENSTILVGTWSDAAWAISFYQKHGFRLLTSTDVERLLRKYWEIPERQVETSVVLKLEK
jgi:GNAT superfamily N-acetyltransferase